MIDNKPHFPLRVGERSLSLPKAIVAPDLKAKTVLAIEPWDFVALTLARNGSNNSSEAVFYWQQARIFYRAAQDLPLASAPLLLYYSFLNATKALLFHKNIHFDERHGVRQWRDAPDSGRGLLSKGVKIEAKGVLPALSKYFKEDESSRTHHLYDMFLNMPFIHRAVCTTFRIEHEMFVPLNRPYLECLESTKRFRLWAQIPTHVPEHEFEDFIPQALEVNRRLLTSKASGETLCFGKLSDQDVATVTDFLGGIRKCLFYINGVDTLWYLKVTSHPDHQIHRQPATLTLAAMHYLSELCRYSPRTLDEWLHREENWLLGEFIGRAGAQFIDEIASEITGKTIMVPGVRTRV